MSDLRHAFMTGAGAAMMVGSTLNPLAGPMDSAETTFTGGGSGYDGANWSGRRGYIYFPTLNTNAELQSGSRLEMMRRGRYLTRNVGFAKRCTRGATNMIGYLSPRADRRQSGTRSRCPHTSVAAESGRGSHPIAAGVLTATALQPMLTSSRLTDGDLGIVLTESQAGKSNLEALLGKE